MAGSIQSMLLSGKANIHCDLSQSDTLKRHSFSASRIQLLVWDKLLET